MKLKFQKNIEGEVIVTESGKSFVSQNYIEMIKQLHAGAKLMVEFGDGITAEEQDSINDMVKSVNSINTKSDAIETTETNIYEEEIDPNDIPF